MRDRGSDASNGTRRSVGTPLHFVVRELLPADRLTQCALILARTGPGSQGPDAECVFGGTTQRRRWITGFPGVHSGRQEAVTQDVRGALGSDSGGHHSSTGAQLGTNCHRHPTRLGRHRPSRQEALCHRRSRGRPCRQADPYLRLRLIQGREAHPHRIRCSRTRRQTGETSPALQANAPSARTNSRPSPTHSPAPSRPSAN